jgi:cysteine desulfurase
MTTRFVYMDHAATTATDPRVVEAMLPYFSTHYGNPSSFYSIAREAAKALSDSRKTIADIMGVAPREIVFTSCGSESDNMALRGVAWAQRQAGKGHHLITTPIEHHAVGHTVEQLVNYFGFEVTYLPVDEYGRVDPDDVGRAIRPDTILVSVMYANNEVGTIEPIAEIGKITRAKGIPFHTDAVQAGGTLTIRPDELNVDLLALSAHKFYGPKGVGLLYVRDGTPLLPAQTGGGQEGHRRAGTENVAYIVGMAKALSLAYEHAESNNARIAALRDRLVHGILSRIPETRLTGHPTERLPNSASFTFKYVEGEAILLNLDMAGVAASSGSACTTGSDAPSHVLAAMGIPIEEARGALRLTLGNENTPEDVDYVIEVVEATIRKLRTMSPLYQAESICADPAS